MARHKLALQALPQTIDRQGNVAFAIPASSHHETPPERLPACISLPAGERDPADRGRVWISRIGYRASPRSAAVDFWIPTAIEHFLCPRCAGEAVQSHAD